MPFFAIRNFVYFNNFIKHPLYRSDYDFTLKFIDRLAHALSISLNYQWIILRTQRLSEPNSLSLSRKLKILCIIFMCNEIPFNFMTYPSEILNDNSAPRFWFTRKHLVILFFPVSNVTLINRPHLIDDFWEAQIYQTPTTHQKILDKWFNLLDKFSAMYSIIYLIIIQLLDK